MRGRRTIYRSAVDPSFVRKADGSLRPAEEGRDIKDVWADLHRVKLREAIERDRKKQTRKERRSGFFRPKKPSKADVHTIKAKESSKTVEIKIEVPQLSFEKCKRLGRRLVARLTSLPFTRKQYLVALGVVVFVALFAASFRLYGNGPKATNKDRGVAGDRIEQLLQRPDYKTVLPVGKTIEELGGWGRVSPPDKEPVFAFKDKIDTVEILVSQQPLPDKFKDNIEDSIAELAKQFSANEKITAGDTQAYIGTSSSSAQPQSVIMTKNDLLILVKSAAKLTNRQWEDYLATLQ